MIEVKVIAHSRANGIDIVTFEIVYQRFIHAEVMTHRLFSRNAASSRAIPVGKVIDQVEQNPALPVHWGKNQPGMQAAQQLEGTALEFVQEVWRQAAKDAAQRAWEMGQAGLHKQVANRILEPFQWMKVVVTATSYDNFFWLRNHQDAQPEIKVVAEKMLEALDASDPWSLSAGEWHTPYYHEGHWAPFGGDVDSQGMTLKQALMISSSCCAQVSFRAHDDSLEKAERIYQRLVESSPVHASPFEHQATPMRYKDGISHLMARIGIPASELTQEHTEWEDGVTHVDRENNFWSGNFKGWIQHRQLIPNNVCEEYVR